MPTGYTAEILRGASFKQFAIKCMENFIYRLHENKNNLSTDGEFKDFKPNQRYYENYCSAIEELTEFNLKPASQWRKEYEEYVEEEMKRNSKCISENNIKKQKYEKVLLKIKNLVPPTEEHLEFKNFMISQVEGSIEFDCNVSYLKNNLKNKKVISFEDWIEQQKSSLQFDLDYAKEYHEKEVRSCKDSNEWIHAALKAINDAE